MGDILKFIYKATNYLDYLKEHYYQDHEARWMNLSELVNIAQNTTNATGVPMENKFYSENGPVGDEEYDSLDDASDFSDIDIDKAIAAKEEKVKEEPMPKELPKKKPASKPNVEISPPFIKEEVKTEQEDPLLSEQGDL